MAATTGLKSIRERIGATQEEIARRTSISFSAYRNAETGKRVTYGTAQAILGAVNSLLQEKGMDSITLDDLGLKLY